MAGLLARERISILGIALLVSIGGILYGYDIGVISGALLFFHKDIPMTETQTGIIVGSVLAGGLMGTLVAGPMADMLGRRIMIGLSSIIFICGVLLILMAHSFATMLAARLVLGTGVGVVAVAVPLYVSEIVQRENRGKYVAFFQIFITFGILLAYFIDWLLAPSGNWRAMFAVVLVPAFVLLLGVIRLPESPRWLVAKGRPDKAMRVLSQTRSRERAESALISIHESLRLTQGGWRELFSRKLWLPLFIAISIATLNQLTGINSFLQYAPNILKHSGLGSDTASLMGSVGIGLLIFLVTIVAFFLIDRVGRRPLLIFGTLGVVIAEVFLGIVNFIALPIGQQGWLSFFGLLAFIAFFAIGPGVIVWLVISELLPTRVRGKAVALCLFFNSLAGTLLASVFLDLRRWLGISGIYWLCAFFTLLYFLITWFLLPETKARSLEEIQLSLQRR